jgi:Rrf2 family protein
VNLNKSTHYALHAALELARAGGRPVTAARVAARHGIPENALAKVLQQLVRAGLARGSRGVGGGYRLARPAGEVTVQEIIDLFEAAPAPAACRLQADARAGSRTACPVEEDAACRLRGLFQEVDETVRATFASVSLATLAG